MSSYWGYRCKRDGDCSPTWFNHGEDQLSLLVQLLPHLRAIQASDCWIVSLDFYGAYDDPRPLEWLATHDGHEIELWNEYGHTAPLVLPEPEGE